MHRATFVLPDDTPPGQVSVVGDFDGWQPGVHTLQDRKDGKRVVTVELPSERAHSYRYVAAGDYWFNDGSGTRTATTAASTPEPASAATGSAVLGPLC